MQNHSHNNRHNNNRHNNLHITQKKEKAIHTNEKTVQTKMEKTIHNHSHNDNDSGDVMEWGKKREKKTKMASKSCLLR